MHQYSQGKFTTQGHKGIPAGHFEEEQGRKGFFGPVSHLIKPQEPTRWNKIEGSLRPHLFDTVPIEKNYQKFQRLLYNHDVVVSLLWEKINLDPEGALRNADGETLYFVHQGAGKILTEYGLLDYRRGSYILIPKCVTHSFYVEQETQFLVIESRGSMFREPDRGMVGKNAFYDPASFGKPDLEKLLDLKKQKHIAVKKISIKREDLLTQFFYDQCVFDTVGWKGDFFPVTLHVDDLMPMMSHRVHLPPSTHTTFVANNFVVCTFLPRLIETDDDALKVPFFHQNIDYDEVLFYHDGDFFSRDNLHSGMITLHPAGFPHGPHPKAFKNILKKVMTNEYAVMVDTWNPLKIDPLLEKHEVAEYWKSWKK